MSFTDIFKNITSDNIVYLNNHNVFATQPRQTGSPHGARHRSPHGCGGSQRHHSVRMKWGQVRWDEKETESHLNHSEVRCIRAGSDTVRRPDHTYCRQHSRTAPRRTIRTDQPDTLTTHTQAKRRYQISPPARNAKSVLAIFFVAEQTPLESRLLHLLSSTAA